MAEDAPDNRRVLVAGVGNIFLGDDAFGVEVIQRLARRPERADVSIVDFGIRGLDLAYTLLDGFATVIIVDAHPRGRRPGTLYVLEPALAAGPEPATGNLLMEGHDLDPVRVFELVKSLGGKIPRVILVGCEPEPHYGTEEFTMSMSQAVSSAVGEAVSLIESLLDRLALGTLEAASAGSVA
jgi:hydrogenase maturation protease